MSDVPDILHESDVREVIQDEIEGSVGATGAAITDAVDDASVAHALNATFSDTEVEGALDALGGKINSVAGTVNEILAILRTNGIIAAA